MIYSIGITGSTGSLGQVILKKFKNYKIKRFKGDIRDREKVFNWILKNKIKVIIHLAAIVPIKVVNENKKKAKDVNFVGTKNVVDAAIKNNVSWFFFSSTSHVYKSSKKPISEKFFKEPISFYGKTKLMAEEYIIKNFKKKKIKFCIGRIFSTTNKNQKKNYLVPDLKRKIKVSKKKIILKNLNHFRDFISMEDISEIIFLLWKKKYQGILNLGSGKSIFLKDIAIKISQKFKKRIYFKDNKIATYLIANIKKLKKIYKKNPNKSLEKMIF